MGPIFSEAGPGRYFQAAQSSEQFTVFKHGLNRAPTPVWDEFAYISLGIACLLLAALVYNFLTRRRRRRIKIWHEETDPKAINKALERASNHWAEYQLEIFSPNYPELYRGRLLAFNAGDSLLLGLPSFQNIELEFGNEPARVTITFRDRPGQPLEQYQFNTHTMGLTQFQDANLKEPAVAVKAPLVLTTAERRQFRRLEPSGLLALQAGLFKRPSKSRPDLNQQLKLASAQVANIGLQGLKASLFLQPGQSSPFKPGQKIMLVIDLPLGGLELSLTDTRIIAQGIILAADLDYCRPGPGRPGGGKTCSLRIMFNGRYWPRKGKLGHELKTFDPIAFQDLAYWLSACERQMIRKERGVLARPARW